MLLELKNIVKIFGNQKQGNQQKALNDINLGFDKGEFVSILGPSGCGKSTFLNIVAGLDVPSSGDLIIEGKSTKKYKEKDWDLYRKNNIGFIFQSFNLIEHLSALENVEMVMNLSGLSKKERIERATMLLEKVGLGQRLNNLPSMLSGGQKQRVAIARALANDPDIILADEPTGALDSKTGIEIMELLRSIAKDKLVIMVTHNKELAYQYSTRVITFSDGKVVREQVRKDFDFEDVSNQELNKKNKKMPFVQAFKLSLKNMKKKKGRVLLTAFAGSIGIAGISLVLGLGNGTNHFINEQMVRFGSSNVISVSANVMNEDNQLERVTDQSKFDFLKENDQIIDFRPALTSQGTWLVNDDTSDVSTFALANPDNQTYLEDFIDGQLPMEGDFEVMVNQAMAREVLRAYHLSDQELEDVIGKKITLDLSSAGFPFTQEFKIAAIVHEIDVDQSMLYYNYQDMKDFFQDSTIPFTEDSVYTLTSQNTGDFEATVQNPHLLIQTRDWILQNYPGVQATTNPMQSMFGNSQGISVSSFALIFYQAFSTIISMIQMVMILFLIVALIVSSILIAIVLFSSVLERKTEIGILKAIGARKKDVLRVFQVEAILLGLFSGLIGIILAFILAPIAELIVSHFTGYDVRGMLAIPLTLDINGTDYPLLIQLGLILISVLVAVIAGYLPAKRATKLKVIDALRED